MKRFCLLILLVLPWSVRAAPDLPSLMAERLRCVVAVEYFTETETERRPSSAYGVVIDVRGTIILPAAAVDPRVTPSQLKEFKVYLPGDAASAAAVYLGQDALTGWHFVQVEERWRAQLVPITRFVSDGGAVEPALAEAVWGIGLRNKDEDFMPYLLQGNVALVQNLPQSTAIAQQEVAGPGLPVFNRAGGFVGLAATSFYVASEILPYLGRVPQSVYGRPLAWLGAYGFEPMDREVAKFLKLEAQSGAVVSEVLEGSPAEKAGMLPRDIVLAIDGQALPRFKPDRVVVSFVEREVERRQPGAGLALTVLRGAERVELSVTLGDEPKLMREAARSYYDRLGFTAREFVYGDAVARRVKAADGTGVIAHFVKSNSPAFIAGLRTDDWIKEIDGVEVKTFAAATEQLAKTESDLLRAEFVLLVSRGGETAVLRVKLR